MRYDLHIFPNIEEKFPDYNDILKDEKIRV